MMPPADGETPSLRAKVSIAGRLRAAIEGSFAHWEAVSGFDLDTAFEAYVDEALTAPTRLAFTLANQRLFAALRNGHTGFSDAWIAARHGRSFGVMIRPQAGQWTVTKSLREEVPVGMVVETIDGIPMAEVLAHRRPFISALSDRAAADGLFYRRHLFAEQVVLGTASGVQFPIAKGDFSFRQPSLPQVEMIGGRHLLRIASFDGPQFEAAAVAAITALDREAPLIIDLRGNGGGNTPLALLAALMERPYRRWRSTVLATTTLRRAQGEPPETVTFDAPVHDPLPGSHCGPLVLLIDGTVGSAAEDFVMPFKDNGRAVLIGETTGGSSGQPHAIDLGGGFAARIGAKRETFPEGGAFEGVGVAPETEVMVTADDLRAGRDPVLDAALSLLR